MVFVTTLIISLMVSLMFFQDPTKQGTPDCTQECTQMEEGGPEVCEEICTEPAQAKKGPLISIVSALVTTPIVFGLTYLFKWLRKPIVEAVEESAEKRSLAKILKSARAAKKKAFESISGVKVKQQRPGEEEEDDFEAEHLDDLEAENLDDIAVHDAAADGSENAKDTADGTEAPKVPRPRHPKYSAMPFCYGTIFGFGGIFMIYGVAVRRKATAHVFFSSSSSSSSSSCKTDQPTELPQDKTRYRGSI
jgi:hypothetical protein